MSPLIFFDHYKKSLKKIASTRILQSVLDNHKKIWYGNYKDLPQKYDNRKNFTYGDHHDLSQNIIIARNFHMMITKICKNMIMVRNFHMVICKNMVITKKFHMVISTIYHKTRQSLEFLILKILEGCFKILAMASRFWR